MKTPRDILLERHQAVAPKLDAIRHEIINSNFRRSDFVATIWLELIWPSRRVWTGLAAIWILIFVANFSMRDHSQMTMAKSSPSPEMIVAYQQQEKLLAELIGPNEPQIAEPPKTFLPQPRSEERAEILMT